MADFLLNLVHNLILFSFLLISAIYLMVFSYKYKKLNPYGFNSTILVSFILGTIGTCVLFIDWLIPYPLNAAINIWLAIILSIQFVYYIFIRLKYKEKGNKENIEEKTYENGELKIEKEYLRKSFHTVIILVVFCYFIFAKWINEVIFQVYLDGPELYYSIWNTAEYPLPPSNTEEIYIIFSWTFMLFVAATIFLLVPDVFRIYNRKYSLYSGIYKKVIRMKELYSVGPQIYLTVGCMFVFMLSIFGLISPLVSLAGMMIAAFGDAAAAIIGRKYGKHQFHTLLQRDERKSYEGFIAGLIVSFFVSLFIVGPFIAILGALIFALIDYLNPKIADNVLNPILCSLFMMIPIWFF